MLARLPRHHTVSQRVADYRQIIESLRGASWWNGKVVLFGGSEAGVAMAMLTPEVRADAAILISTGGGVPFGQMVRQSIPQEGWPAVDAVFEKARQNPDSSELWAGQSLRFWADIIDRRAVDDMLRADTDFLLIQGGNDASGSPDVARATSDLFAKAGRCSLTYWEFPGLDHGMVDTSGDAHMAEVLSQAASWLNSRVDEDASATCAETYRRRIERLTEALSHPDDALEAADAIREVIDRIVVTPGNKHGDYTITLRGELGTILDWIDRTGKPGYKPKSETASSRLSVSVNTGARILLLEGWRCTSSPCMAIMNRAVFSRPLKFLTDLPTFSPFPGPT